jgi:hypothetical protein
MSRKESITAAMAGLFCITLLQLGLIVPSLYFGYLDENSSCQHGTRGGLNLSDWIKGFGYEKVAVNAAMYLTAFLVVFVDEKFYLFGGIGLALDFFFNIAWWIWGVVILATAENNHCVSDGKGMAVMAIVNLVLSGFWFLHLKVATAI